MERKLKIAVYAIAKNEQKFAERFGRSCMDADSIYVGCIAGDDTADILSKLGVNVIIIDLPEFRFDTYRNYVLERIPEDIDVCVSVDLDEVLQAGWRASIEREWVLGKTTRLTASLVVSENSYFECHRIHGRHTSEWRYPIHETLYPKDMIEECVAKSDVKIIHHQDTKKDRSIYLALLEKSVEENSTDTRMLWYLGREYYYQQKYEKSIATFIDYFSCMPVWAYERCWAAIMVSRCYANLNNIGSEIWLLAAAEMHNCRDVYYELAKYYESSDKIKSVNYYRKASLSQRIEIFHEDNGAFSNQFYDDFISFLKVIGDHSAAQKLEDRLARRKDYQYE